MKRTRITISIDNGILEWINCQLEQGAYYNRSHAFEKIMKDRIKSQEY